MYTGLTKIITNHEGRKCVSCIDFDTERCRIHNGVPDCAHCPMFAAILNQLHEFEVITRELENEVRN